MSTAPAEALSTLNYSQKIAFVNKQANRLREIQTNHPDDQRVRHAYKPLIKNFEAIAEDLGRLENLEIEVDTLRAKNAEQAAELSKRKSSIDVMDIRPEDIESLPPEVLKQLSITENDLQDFQLLKVIQDLGGTVSLDKIIIHLFKTTKEVHDRAKMNSRLYRMAAKKMLYSIPTKRGVYSIFEPEQQTAASGIPARPLAFHDYESNGGDPPS